MTSGSVGVDGYDAKYYESNGSNGDRVALRWYARLIENNAPPGRALDFGSGAGWMMRRMSMSRTCDGVEISEYARKTCRIRNPQAMVFGSTREIPDERYAAVLAIHVLEHIQNKAIPETLAEIRRLTVPGGLVLMITPDNDGQAAKIRGRDWRALEDTTHINLQGSYYWRDALVASGFQIVKEGSDGLWDPPYTNWFMDRLRLPRIALDVLTGRITLPVGDGESYIALAKRSAFE